MATHDQPDAIIPPPQITRLETMLNSRRARQRVTLADLEDAVSAARELAVRLAETEETTARWAQYLAPTREALDARDWPSLPETARALVAELDDLADAGTVTEYGVRFPTRDPEFVVSTDRATAERDIARAARHGLRAELVVRIVRYDDWQPADVGDGGDYQ
jgi:citrate lyase beta subunit